jgi:hypothetical protein
MAVWWHENYMESNYFRQPICVAKIVVDPFGRSDLLVVTTTGCSDWAQMVPPTHPPQPPSSLLNITKALAS